jgi:tetratricopeptide (TPR) repeat protein
MTDSPIVEPRPAEPELAPGLGGESPLKSTPVLIGAAAVVLLALIVGAFLLGRSTASSDTDTSASNGSGSGSSSQGQTAPAGDLLSTALERHNAGQLDEALALYQDILLTEPANQYALYNIGLINQTRGANEVAIEYYDRALAVDAAFTDAAYNRALALRDVGQIDESIAEFEVLLVANPDNVGVLYNLGNLLISQGDVVRGAELVNQAVELNPSLRGD